MAIRLNNLALTLRQLGRADEAEPLQRRALAIIETALGSDHPEAAARLSNLTGGLYALGQIIRESAPKAADPPR